MQPMTAIITALLSQVV